MEFSDLVTIAEMTPGPISINAATFVGQRVLDFGALICTIAVILAPILYLYRSPGFITDLRI